MSPTILKPETGSSSEFNSHDKAAAQHEEQRPEPHVVGRPVRRTFTAEYKLRILKEADACQHHGDLGALLRREGLYSSTLAGFRRQHQAGQLGSANHGVVIEAQRKQHEAQRLISAAKAGASRLQPRKPLPAGKVPELPATSEMVGEALEAEHETPTPFASFAGRPDLARLWQVWGDAGDAATKLARTRLHALGIGVVTMRDGVVIEELPDGTIRPLSVPDRT